MAKEKTVKDIMIPFEQYNKVDINAKPGDVLHIRRHHEADSQIGSAAGRQTDPGHLCHVQGRCATTDYL